MDIIGLVDWLETVVNSAQMYDKPALTFEDAARAAAELEGTRFSPLLTARLRDAQTAARLKLAWRQARRTLTAGCAATLIRPSPNAKPQEPPPGTCPGAVFTRAMCLHKT